MKNFDDSYSQVYMDTMYPKVEPVQLAAGPSATMSDAAPVGSGSISAIPQTPFEKFLEQTGLTLEQVGMELDKLGKINIGGIEIGIRDFLPFVGSSEKVIDPLTGKESVKQMGTPQTLQKLGTGVGPMLDRVSRGTGFARQLDQDAKLTIFDVPTIGAALKPAAKVGRAAVKTTKNLPVGASIKPVGEIPTGAPSDLAPAPDVGPLGFYSAASRAVDSIKQSKGTGDQFLAQISKTPGVKPEELQWTGLDDFLKGRKNVTKAEVQEYLARNRVDVQEVTLGGKQDFDMARLSQLEDEYAKLKQHPIDDPSFGEEKYNEMIRLMNIRDQSTTTDLYRQADDAMKLAQRAQARGYQETANNFFRQYELLNTRAEKLDLQSMGMDNPPKFSQYTLPGGENYREILLTLPPKLGSKDEIAQRMFGKPYTQLTDQERFRVTPEFQKTMGQDFRSSHFDQPNILAHMRVNDRIVDGKKTLFIEEVQSDWHQAGRKKGYQQNLSQDDVKNLLANEGYDVNYNGVNWVVSSKTGGAVPNKLAGSESNSQFAGNLNQVAAMVLGRRDLMPYSGSGVGAVPDAPFKTSWHELTLKRAIQEAAEKGYDRIAFTTGKTQAERYDLSKQVKNINVESIPEAQGVQFVDVYTNDGKTIFLEIENGVIREGQYAGKQLDEVVGKELSQRITSLPAGEKIKIEGEDLSIGGQGMKGFYDNILPKSLDKLGKKFDARVGKTTMDGVEVWSMDITPQMRKSVLTKGQPLFQALPAIPAGAAATQDKETK